MNNFKMKHLLEWRLFEANGSDMKLWGMTVYQESVHEYGTRSYLFGAKNFDKAKDIMDEEVGGFLTNDLISPFIDLDNYNSEEDLKMLGKDLLNVGDVDLDSQTSFYSSDYSDLRFYMKEIKNGVDFNFFRRSYTMDIGSSTGGVIDFSIIGNEEDLALGLANIIKSDKVNSAGALPTIESITYFWNTKYPLTNVWPSKKGKLYKEFYSGYYNEFLKKIASEGFLEKYEKMDGLLVTNVAYNSLSRDSQKEVDELKAKDGMEPAGAIAIVLAGERDLPYEYRTRLLNSMKSQMDPAVYKDATSVLNTTRRIL
jgi:hypothetical protein